MMRAGQVRPATPAVIHSKAKFEIKQRAVLGTHLPRAAYRLIDRPRAISEFTRVGRVVLRLLGRTGSLLKSLH
jgi:hypothetical protein